MVLRRLFDVARDGGFDCGSVTCVGVRMVGAVDDDDE